MTLGGNRQKKTRGSLLENLPRHFLTVGFSGNFRRFYSNVPGGGVAAHGHTSVDMDRNGVVQKQTSVERHQPPTSKRERSNRKLIFPNLSFEAMVSPAEGLQKYAFLVDSV